MKDSDYSIRVDSGKFVTPKINRPEITFRNGTMPPVLWDSLRLKKYGYSCYLNFLLTIKYQNSFIIFSSIVRGT